jgi:aspartyl aminopeptidase
VLISYSYYYTLYCSFLQAVLSVFIKKFKKSNGAEPGSVYAGNGAFRDLHEGGLFKSTLKFSSVIITMEANRCWRRFFLEEQKTDGQQLAEKLTFKINSCWETTSEQDMAAIAEFAENYKQFIDKGKTEREFNDKCLAILKENGFIDIETVLSQVKKLKAGAKIYQNNRGKALVSAVIGQASIKEGVNIVGAHIDSPRIDMKTNPLYEDGGFAFFDTHYYGGIKHYQWTTIPLAMHGVVFNKNGEKQTVCIGEDTHDPVFVITDLLPHLAREQMQKKADEFVGGEELNVLAGSEPFKDEKVKERVKLTILRLLNQTYGITEENFASAEIEFVPAYKARDIGLDRSLIGAYGHDDRCCAYTAFHAVRAFAGKGETHGTIPGKTVVCLLTDKEEIGSMGNTGAQSRLFENFIAYLCSQTLERYSDIDLRRTLNMSAMLSTDVNAAYDPNFSDVFDQKTASYCGKGLALSKYTGSRGKVGGSDANAEFLQKVQRILNTHNVRWQFGNMGKVDKGGGGTIAQYAANLGVDVLDCGIPVLSMHSPFEVISKIDLWTAYKGYVAFLKDA